MTEDIDNGLVTYLQGFLSNCPRQDFVRTRICAPTRVRLRLCRPRRHTDKRGGFVGPSVETRLKPRLELILEPILEALQEHLLGPLASSGAPTGQFV